MGDSFDQVDHRIFVAPCQPVAVGVALFSGFHSHRQDVAHLDGIHAKAVAGDDHVADGGRVAGVAVGAQRPRRLVFVALALGLVLALVDFELLLAGHRTCVACRVVGQDVLAHVLTGNHLGIGEGSAEGVAGWQRADDVDHVHQHVCAVDAQTALAGRSHHVLVHDRRQRLAVRFFEGRAILGLRLVLLVALDDQRFEILGAGHCACAAAACCPLVLIDEAGKAHQIFARRADGHHSAVVAMFGLQILDRVARFHSPDR